MTITDEEIAAAEAQVAPLPPAELSQIQPLLQAFCIRHQSHHRPIALVTSGGTATDLEVNSVRFLDNFSTGLRGAVSAEQFLRRGYAVIHLWREGSAAPYTRTLSAALGTTPLAASHTQAGGASCKLRSKSRRKSSRRKSRRKRRDLLFF